MRNIEDCSGRWHCTLCIEGESHLETVALIFDDGRVAGPGSDPGGMFTYSGYVSHGEEAVLFKRYDALKVEKDPGTIVCTGKWDGGQLQGIWHLQDRPWVTGTFELWPVSVLGEEPEAEAEEEDYRRRGR